MAEQYTEVTRTGYGTRIGRSLGGIVFGLLLFLASFVLLFWNEGRTDLSTVARTAAEVAADAVSTDASLQGKLVSATGTLTSEEELGDGLYLKPDDYISIRRSVEMWAWDEKTETKTETKVGGAQETTTTYRYEEKWLENPKASGDFRYPEGHENPTKTLDSTDKTVSRAQVGVYEIDTGSVDLPSPEPLGLTAANTIPAAGVVLASESYLFISRTTGSTLANPEIGDLRISYDILESRIRTTVFGALSGSRIDPYADEDGNELYRVFRGTRTEAITALHEEFVLIGWLLRILGFLMMWIGLSSVFEPLSVVLDVLPFLGKLSRGLVGAVTFLVALVLTAATILISRLLHNPLLLTIVFLVLAAGAVVLARRKLALKTAKA